MKKILVISECLNIDKTSEGISTTNFLNALDVNLFEVDCVFYQFPQFELKKVDWIQSGVNLIQIKNTLFDVILQRFPKIKYLYFKLFNRNLFRERRSYMFKKFIEKHLKINTYELIFVRTIAGSIASHNAVNDLYKKNRFNWIAYFNDPVPITMYPKPYYNGISNKDKHTKREEELVKDIVSNATVIASPSELLNQRILKFCDLSKKVLVFPHTYKKNHVADNSFLDQTKLNIVHSGSLLKERNPRYFLEALELFIKMKPEVIQYFRITFLGGLAEENRTYFEQFKYLEIIELIPRVQHNDALNVINDACIMLIIEAISDESPFMPTKLAEYIGLNKLIWSLAPTKSETRRILGKDYILQNNADDIDGMIEALEHINQLFLTDKKMELNDERLFEYIMPSKINQTLLKFWN